MNNPPDGVEMATDQKVNKIASVEWERKIERQTRKETRDRHTYTLTHAYISHTPPHFWNFMNFKNPSSSFMSWNHLLKNRDYYPWKNLHKYCPCSTPPVHRLLHPHPNFRKRSTTKEWKLLVRWESTRQSRWSICAEARGDEAMARENGTPVLWIK